MKSNRGAKRTADQSSNSEIIPQPKKLCKGIQSQCLPKNYEEIKSGYNGTMVYKDLEENFVYCVSNKNKKNTLYNLRCSFWSETKKHKACPATAKLDIVSNKLFKKIPHNHGADDNNYVVANMTR